MTERDKLIELLEEVKQKIRMLDAIEERLLRARDLVMKSTEVEILDGQRQDLQREIDELMAEVRLLEMDDTENQ
jgi:predicted phosphatase